MREATKIWLTAAGFLVIAGCIIFTGVMTVQKWDFTKLATYKYETNRYEVTEGFESISINTDTADIKLAPSKSSKSEVVCYEQKSVKHSVTVKDGRLIIETVDNRKWYEYIGISFSSPKITVYLPETEYVSLFIRESTGDIEIPEDFTFTDVDISLSTGDVELLASVSQLAEIRTTTGDINLKNIFAGSIELSVSTGNVSASGITGDGDIKINVSTGETNLTDTKCKNIISDGSTGRILLKNVIVAEKLSIERSTGDVKLERSDAAEIFIETDTGDITGSLLSEKIFITHSDVGKVDVPKTTSGGKCEIETDTGDIIIDVVT